MAFQTSVRNVFPATTYLYKHDAVALFCSHRTKFSESSLPPGPDHVKVKLDE